MNCAVIVIGDEILNGNTLDTNSSIISQKLESIGICVKKKVIVSDNISDIIYELNANISFYDILILTGGLGPTSDDKTKEALCDFFNDKLVQSNVVLKDIMNVFEKSKYDTKKLFSLIQNKMQSHVPSKCSVLRNKYGTAPGLWFFNNKKHVVALPGVPKEMEFLLDSFINKLKKKIKTKNITNKFMYFVNIPESLLFKKLIKWENKLPKNIKVAYLPSYSFVKIRLTFFDFEQKKIDTEVKKQFKVLSDIVGSDFIRLGFFNQNYLLSELLVKNKLTISVAESCTGGHVASNIVSTPGASAYFRGGVVAYNDDIKERHLSINKSLLKKHGAVSKEVCLEMSKSIKNKMGTNVSLSTSGYVGSSNVNKNEGSVFISCFVNDFSFVKKIKLFGTRQELIDRFSLYAIDFLIKKIQKVILNK